MGTELADHKSLISTARQISQGDLIRRAWGRGAVIVASGAILAGMLAIACVFLAVETGQLQRDVPTWPGFPVAAVPIAESGTIVLPALITTLVGLSVLKAIGWGNTFIVGTATLVGTLSVAWAILSLATLAAPLCSGREPTSSEPCLVDPVTDAVIATVALAVVCAAVAITIREMLPLSDELRAKEMRDRVIALESRQERLDRARESRAYGRPYPVGLSLPLTALWYMSVLLVPTALMIISVWLIDELSTSVIVAGVLLTMLAVAGALCLHGFALVRFDGLRLQAIPLTFLASVGALVLACTPLLTTALTATTVNGEAYLLSAGLQWLWWLLVLAGVILPAAYEGAADDVALPRFGLFGQVALSLEERTVIRLLRRQRAVDAARRRLAREREPRPGSTTTRG
ncbi:hypothetical protein [Microbacterium invictum]|uniref:MFS family permease n=1 Tax=Microbacterium invictum TaxID=515415 RepID=A0AA40SQW0_9MICO|nr:MULTISPECIES: hypothetical protein [Microbacterium]MBB4140767.1 MFS family permease [Microbacterium invictum]